MKIHLATWLLEASQGLSLTRTGAKRRLISYFHTKDKQKELPVYCRTGINPEKK